jgi:hypothetical protein
MIKLMKKLSLLLLFYPLACRYLVKSDKKEEPTITPAESMYFPSNTDTTWETKSPASLGWNASDYSNFKGLPRSKEHKIIYDSR